MKKFFELLIFLLFLIFILGGCQRQAERTYTDAEAKKNNDNATKLWNGGDIAIVDSLYSIDALYHNADFVDVKGTAKIKGFVKWVYTAYPDFRITLDEPLKLKDRIIYTFQAAGTNDGPLAENMPPTGKKMSFKGVSISKIENGKIIEEWVYYNQLPIYKQLGYKLVPVEEKSMKKLAPIKEKSKK
jgi:steroid delta-isomerase-like uncharacterized protein